MPHCDSFLGKWFYIFCFSFTPKILNQSSWIFNMMYKMHQSRTSFSNFPKIQKKISRIFRIFQKVFRTSWKIEKKFVFDSFKPLLQHPLGGILRRAGPKNSQNGPSSFLYRLYVLPDNYLNLIDSHIIRIISHYLALAVFGKLTQIILSIFNHFF